MAWGSSENPCGYSLHTRDSSPSLGIRSDADCTGRAPIRAASVVKDVRSKRTSRFPDTNQSGLSFEGISQARRFRNGLQRVNRARKIGWQWTIMIKVKPRLRPRDRSERKFLLLGPAVSNVLQRGNVERPKLKPLGTMNAREPDGAVRIERLIAVLIGLQSNFRV